MIKNFHVNFGVQTPCSGIRFQGRETDPVFDPLGPPREGGIPPYPGGYTPSREGVPGGSQGSSLGIPPEPPTLGGSELVVWFRVRSWGVEWLGNSDRTPQPLGSGWGQGGVPPTRVGGSPPTLGSGLGYLNRDPKLGPQVWGYPLPGRGGPAGVNPVRVGVPPNLGYPGGVPG